MHRFTRDSRTAGRCGAAEGVRMLPVVFSLGLAMVCDRVEERPLEEPERPVIGSAESRAGVDHLVENRLQAYGAGDRAKDAADRALLPAHVLELTSELRAIGGHASHFAQPSVTGRVSHLG